MATTSDQQVGTDINNGNGLLLYCYHYSYYSQKVIMALHEKKVPCSFREIQITKGEQYEPWFLQINPKGEVPVLKDGVRVIPDSSRIIDYIEDNFSNGNKPNLVPKKLGPAIKQKVDYFRCLLDQLPAGVITMGSFYHPDLVGERRFPFNFPVGDLIKKMDINSPAALAFIAEKNPEFSEHLTQKANLQKQKRLLVEDREQFQKVLTQVDDALAQIEAELAGHAQDPEKQGWWLCCEDFTVADISLCVLLERLRNVGLSKFLWGPEKRPYVTKYLSRAEKRDCFTKTMCVPIAKKLNHIVPCPIIVTGLALMVLAITGFIWMRKK